MTSKDRSPFKSVPNPWTTGLPNALRIPEVKSVPSPWTGRPKPTQEEQHYYESSATLIKFLEARIKEWRKAIPKDAEAVVLGILANGTVIDAHHLVAQGHHGIVIEGVLFSPDDSSGASPCMVVAHQANLQLLCYVRQVPKPRRPRVIGFGVVDADESTA
ncbi:MAG: hypothetical protein DME61_09930 [Verrucomicrobia bacterium]|nr:MAG: hypothetical protein DME61_09930 [Verrucomicrobiota bacterium]